LHTLASFILFLHYMDHKEFSSVLQQAFSRAASEHGLQYPEGGAAAWALVGASYLGFALCGLSSAQLRQVQYSAREQFGPVILDCKWYDSLKTECLNNQELADALLPGPDGSLCRCSVSADLFLEMLDFCREG